MKLFISLALLTTLSALAAVQNTGVGTNALSPQKTSGSESAAALSPQEQEEAQRKEAQVELEKQKEEAFKTGPYDKDGNYTYDIHTGADDEAAQGQ